MAIPVYVVTGFLDSGKTTFLNHLLNRRDWRDVRIIVIQFETGEEDFQSRYGNCPSVSFPKKMLEQQPAQIVEQIRGLLQSRELDELWIEWNGVVPFSQLQALLLHASLRNLCKIQKVIHVADGGRSKICWAGREEPCPSRFQLVISPLYVMCVQHSCLREFDAC